MGVHDNAELVFMMGQNMQALPLNCQKAILEETKENTYPISPTTGFERNAFISSIFYPLIFLVLLQKVYNALVT